jgi:hypothetical protein
LGAGVGRSDRPAPTNRITIHAKSVVLEVAEAVGLSTDEFHFVVKAFGDSVIAGEAPHSGDFFRPSRQAKLLIGSEIYAADAFGGLMV